MGEKLDFILRDTDPNITEDSTFGTTWRDTWLFQCPDGMMVILNYNGKKDEFSLVAYDSADAVYVAPDALVQIEVRDPSQQRAINIYGPANYVSSSEVQDIKKKAKLQLDQPVFVKPRDYIAFMTKDSTGMDAASVANSYCRLKTTKELIK